MPKSYQWGFRGVYGVGACVYGVGACVYGNPMILVSAALPLGLIGFLNMLGLGWGRVWGVWGQGLTLNAGLILLKLCW